MRRNFAKALLTASGALIVAVASSGVATAQEDQRAAEAVVAAQENVVINTGLSIEAYEAGDAIVTEDGAFKISGDGAECASTGVAPVAAAFGVDLQHAAYDLEMATLNLKPVDAQQSATRELISPAHTRNSCDRQYNRDGNTCRRMRGARARAICWSAITAKYAACLASASR